MTTFEDGPAKGQTLRLQRSPFFLRVVQSAGGQWDALDKLDDKPEPTETIHVYRLASNPVQGFWDGRDKAGRRTGGQFSAASYRLVETQPADEILRDKHLWQMWCEENASRYFNDAELLAEFDKLPPEEGTAWLAFFAGANKVVTEYGQDGNVHMGKYECEQVSFAGVWRSKFVQLGYCTVTEVERFIAKGMVGQPQAVRYEITSTPKGRAVREAWWARIERKTT